VLEMQREILTKEALSLLERVKGRREAEGRFVEALRRVNELRLRLGEPGFRALSCLSRPPSVLLLPVSFQGVPCPQIRVSAPPDTSLHYDAEVLERIGELWGALAALIEVANAEAAIRCISEQLVRLSQIINSLDRNVIPALEDAIRRVEERVAARELEEHVRARRLRGA